MKRRISVVIFISFVLALVGLPGCSNDPVSKLNGTWKGKTKIDQDIAITIRPDSTIEIETQVDTLRQIRKGTFRLVDRRLRIALTTLDTYAGDVIKHEAKVDQDEALYTFTSDDEIVLRKGTQVIILQRVEGQK
jgi:hypothetical protein